MCQRDLEKTSHFSCTDHHRALGGRREKLVSEFRYSVNLFGLKGVL
jgi:hypothetical protein